MLCRYQPEYIYMHVYLEGVNYEISLHKFFLLCVVIYSLIENATTLDFCDFSEDPLNNTSYLGLL